MEKYTKAASNIIMAQKTVMGPLALDLAKRVDGLVFTNDEVAFNKEPKDVLSALIVQYKTLFGDASVRVSKEAIKDLKNSFTLEELPQELAG